MLAEAALNLMGEEGKLFTQVITRDELKTTKRKSLSNMRINPRSTVLILDDNAKNIWNLEEEEGENDSTTRYGNLVQIRPFVYFTRERKQKKKEDKMEDIEDSKKKRRAERYLAGLGEAAEPDRELLYAFELLCGAISQQ